MFSAAHIHPPITRAMREEALRRLTEERAKFVEWIMPDGTRMSMVTGHVHVDDLRCEYGYAVVLKGYDRFGWPTGHPDSPATTPTETSARQFSQAMKQRFPKILAKLARS